MGNAKAASWFDDAGLDPESGERWRVCDMVGRLEGTLGRSHSPKGAQDWQVLWEKLDDGQKSQYTAARGRRPRKRA
jgi:hypothetical protein